MTQPALTSARILVVDDQEVNVELLTGMLGAAGYVDVRATTDARQALAMFEQCEPDIVLLDLHMPHLDGIAVLGQLLTLLPGDAYLPVLIMTGDDSLEAKQRALSVGAKDFLSKPFSPMEALLRIRNLLETRFLYMQQRAHNDRLEWAVRERTAEVRRSHVELERSHVEAIERLARAAEYRDDTTGQHARRVGDVSALLAGCLGKDGTSVELLRRAAQLHDIGKIGIPDAILLKPGRFTPEEASTMRAHTRIGATIVGGSASPLLRLAEQVALTHHDRWDGQGNATGLAGNRIPSEGRIVAVADVLDALLSVRPYKKSWSLDAALGEIVSNRGRQFDPEVVGALEGLARTGALDAIYPMAAAQSAPAVMAA